MGIKYSPDEFHLISRFHGLPTAQHLCSVGGIRIKKQQHLIIFCLRSVNLHDEVLICKPASKDV